MSRNHETLPYVKIPILKCLKVFSFEDLCIFSKTLISQYSPKKLCLNVMESLTRLIIFKSKKFKNML